MTPKIWRFLMLGALAALLAGLLGPLPAAPASQTVVSGFGQGAQEWDLQPGWSVISVSGAQALEGRNHAFAVCRMSGSVQSLQLKLNILGGAVHLNVRSEAVPGGLRRYFIGLAPKFSYIKRQAGATFHDMSQGPGIKANTWHTIRVELSGQDIRVFADGHQLVSAHDPHFIPQGGLSLESLDNSHIRVADLRLTGPGAQGPGQGAPGQPQSGQAVQPDSLFPGGTRHGDLTLSGNQTLTLAGRAFEMFGNITLRGHSRLVIRDASLKVTRGPKLLNHWGIYLKDQAELEVLRSPLFSLAGTLLVIQADNQSRVSLKNSKSKIHLFNVFNDARAVVENSEIVGDLGGLVAANGTAEVRLVHSRVGAVNLNIPSGASLDVSGLRTGHFANWDLQKDGHTQGINYKIILVDSDIVADTVGPGPYERGWPVFIDSGAKVRIRNSEVRKIVLQLRNEKADFQGFSLNTPRNFQYKNIRLENVTVKGQWGVFLHGSSDVTVKDSEGFWTFLFDKSRLRLVNTHMNEFDPRQYKGEISFENCRWDTAAEILDHCDFTMKGSLTIGQIGGFSWENSRVRRVYEVQGPPGTALSLSDGQKIIWKGKTDGSGRASFSLTFDDSNFQHAWKLGAGAAATAKVEFLTSSPIKVGS